MINTTVPIAPELTIYDSVAISATTSSAATALPLDSSYPNQWQVLMIVNEDTINLARFKLGGSSVAATSASTSILPGNTLVINRNSQTYIAFKSDTSTVKLTVTVGGYGPQ